MLAKTSLEIDRRRLHSRVIAVVVVLVLVLALVSCMTPQPKPPVLSENLKATVQNVGLVAIRTDPEFVIEMPSAGSSEGAGDGAKYGAAMGASPGLDIAAHGGGYGPGADTQDHGEDQSR